MRQLLSNLILVFACANLSACGYNKLQGQDEAVKAAWSEVVNQYQRRADLVPNLVNTVKGFAAQEERVLVGVTEARARASSIQLTPELINDPVAFQKFQESQAQLTSALKTLLATVEAYPDLKSNASFRDLAAQLEGTENRISVERRDFNLAVQSYNTAIKSFPAVLYAGILRFSPKPYFSATPGAETPPKVQFDFGTPATNKP